LSIGKVYLYAKVQYDRGTIFKANRRRSYRSPACEFQWGQDFAQIAFASII
jgi:hypothetical protein